MFNFRGLFVQRAGSTGNEYSQVEQRAGDVPDLVRSTIDQLRDIWIARAIAPHFDRAYYLSQCSDPSKVADPALDYVRRGARAGLDPSPDFSTTFYRQKYGDVRQSGNNPFWHYVRYGKAEGRIPRPPHRNTDPAAAPYDLEAEVEIIRGEFDTQFYRRNYTDLPADDANLAAHYLTSGWLLGHDPNGNFSTRGYLRTNPDVAAARTNPFVHFLIFGRREQRGLEFRSVPLADPLADIGKEMQLVREHFDRDFYLSRNPDVTEAGVDPLFHFCAEGHREGRDPSPDFSTSYYLASNPDVREAGLNAFVHYIVAGRSEGRRPKHPGGKKYERLMRHRDLESLVDDWRRNELQPELMAARELHRAISRSLKAGAIILSIGHDDHQKVSGGVQLCIQKETLAAVEAGFNYLAIFPWQPLPRLARFDQTPDVLVQVILNGEPVGVCRSSVLSAVIQRLSAGNRKVFPTIHQLLGHNPEQITELVKASGGTGCILWLHDYSTLCPSSNLQRNGFEYCGGPEVTSTACMVCIFGAERASHVARVRKMFDELEVHVVAPSASVRNIWEKSGDFRSASVSTQPHISLSWKRRKRELGVQLFDQMKIAYLGAPVESKGWNVFEEIIGKFSSEGHKFYHFGVQDINAPGVRHVPVHVTAEDAAAMTDSVTKENIDFVLHWSSCPETFSFTTFEAMAAGSFVLTNPNSGNVAAAVRKHRKGSVFADKEDLLSFFSDGRAELLLEQRRSRHCRFAACASWSSLSLAVIQERLS